ncbi:MAG: hypothetical protein KC478_05175 [Bacteriovoracaceae bacterium]|nr:hypothetical protein [Bacteriovoracaceae bacterium]
MKALVFALFIFAQAFGATKVKLSSGQLTQISSSLAEIGENYAKESGSERRDKLGQYKSDLMDIVNDLYIDGYVKLEQLKSFEHKIDAQSAVQMCESDKPEDCGTYLKNFFNNFHSSEIKYKEPQCVPHLGNATAGQCCEPLTYHKLPFVGFQDGASCAPAGNSCSEHSECCSNVCGDNGKCVEPQSCYKLQDLGQACPTANPYCKSGCPMNEDADPNNDDPTCKATISCLPINYNSSGVGECKPAGNSCESNVECCSNTCESGKCVPKSICTDCAKMGEMADGKSCCPGTFLGIGGRCIQDFPPFTLPTTKVDKSVIEKIINLVIPSAHAASEAEPTIPSNNSNTESSTQQACPDVFEGKSSQDWYNAKLGEQTTRLKNASEDEVKKIMAEVDSARRQKEREHADCLATNGEVGEGKILTRNEYRDLYNMPNILSKTFSNVRECEFNTLNDSWRTMSYSARNAELALMAFEATYSGQGHDMIVSGKQVDNYTEAHGKNIFTRAQNVANVLRKNRSALVDEFRALDIKMSCKCLAIFGPSKFGAEKKAFFDDQCSEEAAYVTEDHIRDDPNSDGSSSGNVEEKTEVDRGAVGISHEKLMVEWLAMRRDIQFKRFTENEKLEEQFMALSQFITEYPWYEPPGPATQYQKVEKLYTFYTWKWKGWVMIVLVALAVAAAVFFGPMVFTSLGSISVFGLGALSTAGALGLAGGVMWAALSGLFNNNGYDPSVRDVKVGSGCWKKVLGICIQDYKKYDRYLEWPYFNSDYFSSAEDQKYKCEVYGQSTSCVKSVYLASITYSNGNPEDEVVVENNPLLDVPLPMTVKKEAYDYEQVRKSKTYAQLLNEAYLKHGLPAMKATKSEFKRKGSKYYVKEKKYKGQMLKRPLTAREELMKKFVIDEGRWVPKKFEEEGREAFLKGIAHYAMCEKLNQCAYHSFDLLGDTEEERDKMYGFGHVFEKDEDAKIFAEYAYQMHLVWPRLSADTRIGYPTLGLDAYFQTMAYNLRLAGSLALKRTFELGESYELYKADWEKRKSDYKGLGGAEEGDGSKNVTVGEKQWAAIKSLSFKNNAQIAGLPSQIEGMKSSGKFDSGQLSALEAVERHAIRAKEEQAKRDHYDKTYGQTERGKQKVEAAQTFSKQFNTPLNKMAFSVGGKELGGLNNPNVDEVKEQLSEEGVETAKQTPKIKKYKKHQSQFNNMGMGYNAGPVGRNYGQGSSTSLDSESGSHSGNSALSGEEAAFMVEAASNDSSLDEVLPGDSIFTVVSKAYKRNLSRVLIFKNGKKIQKDMAVEKSPPLSDSKKDELKDLLLSN